MKAALRYWEVDQANRHVGGVCKCDSGSPCPGLESTTRIVD